MAQAQAADTTGPQTAVGASQSAPDSRDTLMRLMTQVKSRPDGAEDSNRLARELWSSRISALESSEDVEASLALRRLIRQVKSVKFNTSEPAPAFTAPPEPQVVRRPPQPEPTRKQDAAKVQPAVVARAHAESRPSLSAKALNTLENLRQNPDRVRNPLEMAELLFLNGRPTDAVPFYEKALEHMNPSDPLTHQDRAWALFQLGNCLRDTDLARAQNVYMKLIAEHPESPWTELAKAHGRLLAWYQQNQPRQLMAAQ